MHNHTFRLIDVAAIVEAKTGKTIADGDADGRYDAEVVLLSDSDLQDLQANGVDADTVYFGDLAINGLDSTAVDVQATVNGVQSIKIRNGTFLPVGNIQPCVIFDDLTEYAGCFCTFYGWKITLNP